MLATGDYFLLVREYGGVAGAAETRVLPPLQRWANDNVMVLGHGCLHLGEDPGLGVDVHY